MIVYMADGTTKEIGGGGGQGWSSEQIALLEQIGQKVDYLKTLLGFYDGTAGGETGQELADDIGNLISDLVTSLRGG